MYNGYKNYETWNVVLWISNDEGLYNVSTMCANYEEFKEYMRELGGPIGLETPDNIAWNDSGVDVDEVNSACFAEDAEDVVEPEEIF